MIILLLSYKYSVLVEFVQFVLFLAQIVMMVYLNVGTWIEEELKTT